MSRYIISSVIIGALSLASVTSSAIDKKRGKRVFNKCKACHSLIAGRNHVGPTLYGIFGRKAAILPNYRYSKAMKNSGITWDEESLRKYLERPRVFVKGTRMAFAGVKKRDEMDDLIAFLKDATK